MYGKFNAILRSKAAMWSVMFFAVLLFCVTATLAFGLHAQKRAGVRQSGQTQEASLGAAQSSAGGLQVQNSAGAVAQLQGQTGNGSVSQPAAPASVAPNAGLDSGLAASQVQANGNATVGPASTSLSTSLQPSAVLGGSGDANVQASLNALGLNASLGAQAP